MSENKSWFSRINPFSQENANIKALANQLENRLSDLTDSQDYDMKYLDTEPSGFNTNYTGDFSGIDQQIDSAALQRIFTTETWVYSAVMAIAKDIAELKVKGEKSAEIVKQVVNEVTGVKQSIKQKVWIDAGGEKVFDLFEKPNKYASWVELISLLVIDLMTAGEFYIYQDSDIDLTSIDNNENEEDDANSPFSRLARVMGTSAGSRVKALYRIPPPMMKPVPADDRTSVVMYAMQSDRGVYAFNFAEIIHVKLPNPNDPFRGLSPLVAAFKPVLLDRFSTEHMVRFYKSGARLGGVIETKKSLNKEQLARFQRSFEGNFTGRKNHHRTLILPPDMTYKTIEQNPAETALLDFCRYNREAVLAVFHVPPIKLGLLDNSTYANALVQLKFYFGDTIKPLLSFIEDGFNNKSSIFTGQGLFRMKFDLSEVEALKEDMSAKADIALKMLNAGLSTNEVRKMVWDKAAVEKGDRVMSVAQIDKLENGQGGGLVIRSLEPDDVKDAVPLSTENQPSLIPTGVAGRGPKKPCDKCKKDPCECPPEKKTVHQFVAEAILKLDPSEKVTPELIAEIISIYNEQNKVSDEPVEQKDQLVTEQATVQADTAPKQNDIIDAPKLHAFGMSKDQVVEHWKSFISKNDPIIEKRHAQLKTFFKQVQSVMLNRLGASIKSFGLHKAVGDDDINEITRLDGYEGIIREYIAEIDKALKEAYEQGYSDTLVDFKFDPPNEVAAEFLKQYGADEVTRVLDTTREQIKEVLSTAFDEGVAMGEVAIRLREKFAEIDDGRAWTIARTETLSAVSAGQQQKREDFQEQFPDKVLMKAWVSAQDDRVRDSHADLDGEAVESTQDFSNGLQYPRESGGAPEEVINCRCTTITYAEEQSDSIDEELPPKAGQEDLDANYRKEEET